MSKKVIIPLTGGLDSTYAVWDELSNTDNQVIVWYINETVESLKTNGFYKMDVLNGTDIKTTTINNVVSWLKTNVRDFTFEYKTIDYTDKSIHPDLILDENRSITSTFLRMAINEINNNNADVVVSTMEYENDGGEDGLQDVEGYRYNTSTKREEMIFRENANRGELSFKLLDMNYTQATSTYLLPEELFNLTRSCTNVTSYEQIGCGDCRECNKRKIFKILLNTYSNDLNKIWNFYYNTCLQPEGKWKRFRDITNEFLKNVPVEYNLFDPPVHGKSVNLGE